MPTTMESIYYKLDEADDKMEQVWETAEGMNEETTAPELVSLQIEIREVRWKLKTADKLIEKRLKERKKEINGRTYQGHQHHASEI